MMTRFRNTALFFIPILSDQLSKYIIRNHSGFYICNNNLAFGLPFFTIFVIPTLIFALFILNLKLKFFSFPLETEQLSIKKLISNFKFQISKCSYLQIIGILLFVSGAISNIIDRLLFGCVTDFIDLKIWPVFNLADIFISIGATMIIYKNIVRRKPS